MHAKVFSATTIGINAQIIDVEVDISLGLVQFHIVGLPDTAIKESCKRIRTALKNSGISLPTKVITVNLAPADVRKEGTLFDLPIAVAILQASNLLSVNKDFFAETIFLGELSLDGSIRSIKGALAITCDVAKQQIKRIILPEANAVEAALIPHIEVIGVSHITQLVAYLRHETSITPMPHSFTVAEEIQESELDFCQVKGQAYAKRALQIAATGRHNILFMGPPGSGKSMLAQRLPTIMPSMTFDEIVQTSKIYSVSGKLIKEQPLIKKRPFRNPHHTISQAGLVGGGSYPQPGEISLATNGILFLDELSEFKRSALEVLRQPLEEKNVSIARAQYAVTFPASFLLVAALNPCPCGFLTDKKRGCICSPLQINRYLQRLSGPLLDRIDLQINIQSVEYETITNKHIPCYSSAQLFEPIQYALQKQYERFGTIKYNADMSVTDIESYCILTPDAQQIVKQVFETLHLSMRGYHKLLKVARTIADLSKSKYIHVSHISEAVMYRSLDQHLEQQRI